MTTLLAFLALAWAFLLAGVLMGDRWEETE